MKYCYDRANYDGIRKHMAQVDWDQRLNGLSLEETWVQIKYVIHESVEANAFSFSITGGIKSRLKRPEWINEFTTTAL